MTALFNIVPAAYRWLALILLMLALVAFGYVKGVQHEEGAEAKRELAQERATAKLNADRATASNKVDLKYAPALTQIRTVTQTIVKEVPVYVTASDCPMPGGFRVLHDAAAVGQVPDPAGLPDAAPVPAQDAASTVAENYGTCLENAKRLEGLQEWVHGQLSLNPKE